MNNPEALSHDIQIKTAYKYNNRTNIPWSIKEY